MIATLATRAADAGIDVVVVTGDRDSYQLVRRPAHQGALQQARRLRLRALRRGRHRRAHRASRPRSTPSTRRCAATPSDNLPGVPGIGEKTAAKLITTYGDLEGIFEHLDELPPKQRQNLGEARDRVFQNREMSLLVPRRRPRGVDARRPAAGRVRPRAGAGAVRPARVPHAAAAAARRGRRDVGRGRRRGRRRSTSRSRSLRDARRGRRAVRRARGERRARTRSSRAGTARRSAARSSALGARARRRRVTYIDADLLADADGARRARRARRAGRPAARRAPRQGADARPRRRRAHARSTTPR